MNGGGERSRIPVMLSNGFLAFASVIVPFALPAPLIASVLPPTAALFALILTGVAAMIGSVVITRPEYQ